MVNLLVPYTFKGPTLDGPVGYSIATECLSPLPNFKSRPGHVRILQVTWGGRWFSPGTAISSTMFNFLTSLPKYVRKSEEKAKFQIFHTSEDESRKLICVVCVSSDLDLLSEFMKSVDLPMMPLTLLEQILDKQKVKQVSLLSSSLDLDMSVILDKQKVKQVGLLSSASTQRD